MPSDDAMLRDIRTAAMEERIAYLEGKVNEQSQSLSEARDAIVHLEGRVEARLSAMDTKMSWLVGIQITALIAQVAGLIAVVGALVARA